MKNKLNKLISNEQNRKQLREFMLDTIEDFLDRGHAGFPSWRKGCSPMINKSMEFISLPTWVTVGTFEATVESQTERIRKLEKKIEKLEEFLEIKVWEGYKRGGK